MSKKNRWRLPLIACASLLIGTTAFIIPSGSVSKDFHNRQEIETYSQHSQLQWDWALSSLAPYSFHGNESVLDIGCGEGKITAEISRRVPQGRVVGIDISPAMINFASSHYSRSVYRHLLFMQGDATQNPFSDQFDLVVSFCAMQFIEDQKAVVEGIKNALSPGGKALLVMPETYAYNLSPVSERLAKKEKWVRYFDELNVPIRHYKSVQDYKQILEEVGLQALSIKSIMIDDLFDSRESLVQWILTISSFAKALPQELQRQFAEEVADGMLTECPAPNADGSLLLRSPKLEVWLQKSV